jgi:hypothetical protein
MSEHEMITLTLGVIVVLMIYGLVLIDNEISNLKEKVRKLVTSDKAKGEG